MKKHCLGLVLIGLTAFSATCFAGDFGGHWVGTGSMSMPGYNSACSNIEIQIQQSAGQLVVQSYHATCGWMDSSWGPDPMQIQGTSVIDQGDNVGTISDTTLLTKQTEGTVTYIFNLTLTTGPDGKPELQSQYGTANDAGTVMIQGALTQLAPLAGHLEKETPSETLKQMKERAADLISSAEK